MAIVGVMAQEENVSKYLYKIELYLIKIIPIIISVLYFINTILSCIGINLEIFSVLGGMSLLPLIFFYVSSYAFRFCSYHRMFLNYILTSETLAWIDYKYNIISTDKVYLTTTIILFSLTIIIATYLKFRNNED